MLPWTDYRAVPPGPDIPRVVHAIVEIPKGRRSKFEVDKKTGLIRLERTGPVLARSAGRYRSADLLFTLVDDGQGSRLAVA